MAVNDLRLVATRLSVVGNDNPRLVATRLSVYGQSYPDVAGLSQTVVYVPDNPPDVAGLSLLVIYEEAASGFTGWGVPWK